MKDDYKKFYNSTNEIRKRQQQVRNERRKKQRINHLVATGAVLLSMLLVVIAIIYTIVHFYKESKGLEEATTEEKIYVPHMAGVADKFPDLPISEQFLTLNEYSRPGLPLTDTPQYIVIHYTANPTSTAQNNRDYFENLKDTQQTYASAQFVIGLDGEIIQCVPCNEMAYCSNSLNEICISIEMCHPDEWGNFNDATYNNCVYLVAHLMNYYHMDMDQLIRHYDVTGKNCPRYFVEHEDRWEVFKQFVEQYREEFQEADEKLYQRMLLEEEQQEKDQEEATITSVEE